MSRDERSPGSVSWQSRAYDDSARNSEDGSRDSSSRPTPARSGRARGDAKEVTSGASAGDHASSKRRDGRAPRPSNKPERWRGGGSPETRGLGGAVSKNFVVFVCAGLAFFGISAVGAGRSNRAFERHFQELEKVRADRRKLREENESLLRENARLRARAGGGGGGFHQFNHRDDSYHADSYDDAYGRDHRGGGAIVPLHEVAAADLRRDAAADAGAFIGFEG